MKERMIERVLYTVLMLLLARWGVVATDVAVDETWRAERKQELGDSWRSLYAEALIEIETLKDNCPPEGEGD